MVTAGPRRRSPPRRRRSPELPRRSPCSRAASSCSRPPRAAHFRRQLRERRPRPLRISHAPSPTRELGPAKRSDGFFLLSRHLHGRLRPPPGRDSEPSLYRTTYICLSGSAHERRSRSREEQPAPVRPRPTHILPAHPERAAEGRRALGGARCSDTEG